MDNIRLDKILRDNNEVKLFETVYQDEKILIKIFLIAFLLIFILINTLIFSVYYLSFFDNYLILPSIKSEYLHHLFANYYIKLQPFLILVKKGSKYYNFTILFFVFTIINMIYLILGYYFYQKLILYIKDIKSKIEIMHQIQLKNEKDFLSARVIEKITEHINHEIKPPLLSLKNIIKEYENIIRLFIKTAKPGGDRLIDKMVYPSHNVSNCKYCEKYDKNNPVCEFYSWYGKSLPEILNMFSDLAKTSINQINSTIKITKTLKSLKQKDFNVSVYDVFKQSVLIFTVMRKYKFDYKIDKKFKNCFLNGLSPEILSNIIMNHVKNSLEAHANVIKIIYKGYYKEAENKKAFLYVEIVDNGDGIPEAVIDKIYDLDFSTKKNLKKENSGVGLYLSKQLLKYYGGDENVIMTSNEGTVFCLKIPVKYCLNIESKFPENCEEFLRKDLKNIKG
jgi:signal transduction histidine kinase